MKMSEMRKAKISWVKRETKRTKKLPSRATMSRASSTSQRPIHTRPTRYSRLLLLQNEKKASSKTSRGPEKPITNNGWAPNRQKSTPWMAVDMMSSDTPIRSCVFSPSSPEGDGGRQGCEVDEDDSGQALGSSASRKSLR